MTSETRRRWTGQGTSMCPLERRRRHGPIRPMEPETRLGLIARLIARLLRKVRR